LLYRNHERQASTFTHRIQSVILPVLALIFFGVPLLATAAHADIGVILSEALDDSVGKVTKAGHSAVYFSRICPETPVKLRLCRPGEMGSVISNYTTLGEDQPFEWNDAPLSIFLYGVDDPRNRPLIALPQIKRALEERYRDEFLSQYCATDFCRTSNKSEWRYMVGATLERSLYIFVVHTSVQQDLAFINHFNSSPNVNHFNGVTHNCATFVRGVVDFYYPHSAHADYLNDFMMASPKAIARTFTRWALRHPEMNLRVLHFAQLPGTIKLSFVARSGTEEFIRTKKFYPPMVWFAPYGMPAAAGAYYLTGRFNPEHELEQHPDAVETSSAIDPDTPWFESIETQPEGAASVETGGHAQVFGSKQEWKQFHVDFDGIVDEAVEDKIIPGQDYVAHFAKQLQQDAKPVLAPNGEIWLDVVDGGQTKKLGVSANNIFGPGSNSELAYALLLAREQSLLKSPKHRRESMPEFRADWQLLESSRTRIWATQSNMLASAQNRQPQPTLVAAKP